MLRIEMMMGDWEASQNGSNHLTIISRETGHDLFVIYPLPEWGKQWVWHLEGSTIVMQSVASWQNQ